MNNESINKFLEKNEEKGELLSRADLDSLNQRLSGLIPDWFIEIVTTIPLAGMNIGWQAFSPEDDYDGIEEITLLDTALLKECNLDSYPGMYLWVNGYFTFGYGANWAGNCFAFNPNEGRDPPVYEVWHDAANDKESMLTAIKEKKGVTIMANTFSELFDNAVFE